jgi:PhnB protein
MQLATYLLFDGTCGEAFRFYEQALGGKIDFIQTFGDSPERDKTPPDQHHLVIHVHLTVGDQVLMGSDAPPPHFERPQGFSVSIAVDDKEEATRIYRALAEGGRETMPLGETFWSPLFGMCTDRFGTPWMVNYAPAQSS